MPLPMVHLKVANSVLTKGQLDKINMSQYYIGSLAPDGAHNRKDYNYLIDRKLAHLEEYDASQWFKNIETLLETKMKDKNFSFYLGYTVHIMTDIYWQQTISAKFHQLYSKTNNLPFANERKAYTAEMSFIDMQLYTNESMKNEIWGYLQSAAGMDFLPYVSAVEIEMEKAITLSWYDNKKNCPTQYPSLIKYEDVIEFIDYSTALIIRKLQCT